MAKGGHDTSELNQVFIENLHIHGQAAIYESAIGRALIVGNNEVANINSGQTNTDGCGNKTLSSVTGPKKNDKDLAWLVEGKIVMYRKRTLSKTNKKVFYGKQQFSPEYWREVAIKLIEYKKKNVGEMRILLKLHHPNIVQMFDAGEYQAGLFDYLYIVMELCAQNLRDFVDENPFSFPKSFSFSKQLAAGLAFLHHNQIAHRDLKPDNVLISFDKKAVKLTDFGISKEIPSGQSAASVTAIGAGTEGFRSPETYQSNTRVSPSVDIFPYGLVVHFTFTKGKHPYGSNPNEWSYNIMKNLNCDLSLIPHFGEPNHHKRAQLLDMLNQALQYNACDRPTAEVLNSHAFFADAILDDEERINENLAETKCSSSLLISSSESEKLNPATSIDKPQSESLVLSSQAAVGQSASREVVADDIKETNREKHQAKSPPYGSELIKRQRGSSKVKNSAPDDSKRIAKTLDETKLSPLLSRSSSKSRQLNPHSSSAIVQEKVTDDGKRSNRVLEKIKSFVPFRNSSRGSEQLPDQQDSRKVKGYCNQAVDTELYQTAEKIDANAKRIKEIENKLSQEIDFWRISQLLNELRQLRGSDDLDILLRVAECEIQMKTGKEVESIDRVRDFISSSESNSAETVWKMAYSQYTSNFFVRALIFYRISNDLHETENVSPNNAVKWIRNIVVNVYYAAKQLIQTGVRSRDIAIVYGLECMNDLLGELRAKNVNPDFRALDEADCLFNITSFCNFALEYQKSIRFGQDGVGILENQFGSNASKHKCYGLLLNNMGTAHGNYGKWLLHNQRDAKVISEHYSQSEHCYVQAIEAKEKALDYENANEKFKDVEVTKRNLEIIRKSLAKQDLAVVKS